MTKDLPFERWPTSAKAVIESATAGDSDSVQRRIRQESMRASERERVEQLWLPRLYRKIPCRELEPDPWLQLRADYTERWCRSTNTSHRRLPPLECEWVRDPSREGPEDFVPDLDAIRCIVSGWTNGLDPKKLEDCVRRWRDELKPAMQMLEPVTGQPAPGPLEFAYVAEELPAVRTQLGQMIDNWRDSPIAVRDLLRSYGPMAKILSRLQAQIVPDAATNALDNDQSRAVPSVLDAIALRDELPALHRLADRGARLAELLADAKRGLRRRGLRMSADGKLQEARPTTTGPKPPYLVQVIWGLYTHLRPFYRKTFDDHQLNPGPLRGQISRLLSPYFLRAEISPERGGPVWHAINNLSYSS